MKHIVSDSEYVVCKECGKQLQKIESKHLKVHNITFEEYSLKYPNEYTITKKELDRQKLNSILMREKKKSIDNKTKHVKCYYCKNEIEVNFNCSTEKSVCKDCRNKGMKSPIIFNRGINPSNRTEIITKKNENLKNKLSEDPNYFKPIIEKRKKTINERFKNGYKDISKLSRQALKDKTGYEFALQKPESFEKQQNTMLVRTGFKSTFNDINKIRTSVQNKHHVNNVMQLDWVHQKAINTNLTKLGVEYPTQSQVVKDKISETNLRTFKPFLDKMMDERNIELLDDYSTGDSHTKFRWKCKTCGQIFVRIWNYLQQQKNERSSFVCPTCFPKNVCSVQEKEVFNFIKQNINEEILENNKNIIYPKEIDIFIPVKKLCIEFNGIYHHSELNGKDKSYHINKTISCDKLGYILIQIFDVEWLDKLSIVKSIILNKLGLISNKIHARKCEIKKVSAKESYIFLLDNHLQKPLVTKYNYGLYYNNELIYLTNFKKSRYNKNFEFELTRSCSKLNTVVIGGFDKLIQHFVKIHNPKNIISYVDRRYFNGNGYKKWNFIGNSEPNYFYTKDYRFLESRIKFQKHKLIKFPEYDERLSEWEIMQLAGYDRIWDCGNLKFEFVNNKYNQKLMD